MNRVFHDGLDVTPTCTPHECCAAAEGDCRGDIRWRYFAGTIGGDEIFDWCCEVHGGLECPNPPSDFAPPQDAATELTVADAQRIAETASEVAAQAVATTLRGRASGEST